MRGSTISRAKLALVAAGLHLTIGSSAVLAQVASTDDKAETATHAAPGPEPPAPARRALDSEPAFHRGLLLMPFVGANLPLGDAGIQFDLGFRIGGVLGYHVLPFLSANVEYARDYLEPNNVGSGFVLETVAQDLTLSPFFHFPLDRGEIVVGPKIGAFWYLSSNREDIGVEIRRETRHGLAFGFNAGVFGAVRNVGLGVLLGYVGRHASETCIKTIEVPEKCAGDGNYLQSLSLTAAVLY